jgi:hypothetical protein
MVEPKRGAAGWALAAFALILGWQLVTVYAGYHGNWTGLYWIGSKFPPPPSVTNLNLVVREGSGGYDGQFFYYMAQDPFLRGDAAASMDVPRFRYRRILLPLLANLLAAGRPPAIAVTYAFVNMAFVALGVFWLGRFARTCGRNEAWGLAFLATPVVLISLDRQTVDAAFAALCIGAALYVRENRPVPLFMALAAAMLTRETGLLLIAAASAQALFARRFPLALALAAAALPSCAWYAYVHAHTPSYSAALFDPVPLRVWFSCFVAPPAYADFGGLAWLPRLLDRIGLVGALLAIVACIARARRGWREFLPLSALLFALLAIWHSAPGTWADSFGYARSFAPLFLLPALDGWSSRNGLAVIPLAFPLPRVLLQLAGQTVALFRT